MSAWCFTGLAGGSAVDALTDHPVQQQLFAIVLVKLNQTDVTKHRRLVLEEGDDGGRVRRRGQGIAERPFGEALGQFGENFQMVLGVIFSSFCIGK